MYFVYMIMNSSRDLYVGVTKNPNERVNFHNKKQGANFTKNRLEFKIVFLEEYKSFKEARQREIQIKKWRRDKKERLISLYKQGLNTKK